MRKFRKYNAIIQTNPEKFPKGGSAEGEKKCLTRIISGYVKYDVLIQEELAYVPFSREGAKLLLQILTLRHGR